MPKRRTKIHEIHYKSARQKAKPIFAERGMIPHGKWLPVSCAAEYAGCTGQTVRLLYFAGLIRGLKYPKGPLLVDAQFIPSLLKRSKLRGE